MEETKVSESNVEEECIELNQTICKIYWANFIGKNFTHEMNKGYSQVMYPDGK